MARLFGRKKKEKPRALATKRSARRREREKVTKRITTLKKRIALEKPIREKPEKIEWLKTEIPGFDELFAKGVPKGKNILVAGGPGTGKTIFCLQTLYNAARKGHDCLYITFEESPPNLRQHMREFGWDLGKVEQDGNLWDIAVGKSGSLVIRKLDPFRIARSVEALLAKAAGRLRIGMGGIPELIPASINPYMIALDSVSALESAFTGRPESYRVYIEQLFRLFEETGSTNFLITETEEATKRYSKTGVEEFLADGVFVFYYIKPINLDTRIRAVEILKLRGAKHQSKIVPFAITGRGMKVYPTERVLEVG